MRVVNPSRRKTKPTGQMPKKERGKAQESMLKGEEGKPNEREREDAEDEIKPDV